jgi:hypothetical protein
MGDACPDEPERHGRVHRARDPHPAAGASAGRGAGWCAADLAGQTSRRPEEFVSDDEVSVVPFSRDMAEVASRAFVTFGRASGHPARLNFGDRLADSVSAEATSAGRRRRGPLRSGQPFQPFIPPQAAPPF